MIEKNNIIITILIIIIAILITDLYLLNIQITNLINILNEQSLKISELENILKKESNINNDSNTSIKIIAGSVVLIGLTMILLYFGSPDLDTLTKYFNITGNQIIDVINNKNFLDGTHMEKIIIHEKNLTECVINHIDSKNDYILNKLENILNSLYRIASYKDYNDLFNNTSNKPTIIK